MQNSMTTNNGNNIHEFKKLIETDKATRAVFYYLELRKRHRPRINAKRLYKYLNKVFDGKFAEGELRAVLNTMQKANFGVFIDKDNFQLNYPIQVIKEKLNIKHIPETRDRKTKNIKEEREYMHTIDTINDLELTHNGIHIQKGDVHIYTNSEINANDLDKLIKLLNNI